MNITALGIDPGIANTGLVIVQHNSNGYTLEYTELIKTKPVDTDATRLYHIATRVDAVIATYVPNIVAIESVYYNRNISSAMTTAGVIAICLLSAEKAGVPSACLKPQTAKAACGLGGKASKEHMLKMTERLFGIRFKKSEAHLADAVFIAMAGILEAKRK